MKRIARLIQAGTPFRFDGRKVVLMNGMKHRRSAKMRTSASYNIYSGTTRNFDEPFNQFIKELEEFEQDNRNEDGTIISLGTAENYIRQFKDAIQRTGFVLADNIEYTIDCDDKELSSDFDQITQWILTINAKFENPYMESYDKEFPSVYSHSFNPYSEPTIETYVWEEEDGSTNMEVYLYVTTYVHDSDSESLARDPYSYHGVSRRDFF